MPGKKKPARKSHTSRATFYRLQPLGKAAIIAAIKMGGSTPDIAQNFGISPSAVFYHRKRLALIEERDRRRSRGAAPEEPVDKVPTAFGAFPRSGGI
jgi:hypothetical protein